MVADIDIKKGWYEQALKRSEDGQIQDWGEDEDEDGPPPQRKDDEDDEDD